VDITGYLTLPRQPKLTNQPFFLAYSTVVVDKVNSFPKGQPFPLTHTIFNEGSCFQVSAGNSTGQREHYFTAPVNGFYRLTIKGTLTSTSRADFVRFMIPQQKIMGGSSWYDLADPISVGLPPSSSSSLTWIEELNSGDKIRIVSGDKNTTMYVFNEIMFYGELAFAK
tara:strand:- start:3156 stop:3659 length:504 start_codon:yes stop_codon:yes gene_type:complete